MKLLVCTLVFIVVACVPCQAENWKEIHKICKNETGAVFEKGKKIDDDDPKVKCYYTCIQKKLGVIDDNGKIIEEKVMELELKRRQLNDAEKKTLKNCVKQANALDGCEVEPALFKCMLINGFYNKQTKKPHISKTTTSKWQSEGSTTSTLAAQEERERITTVKEELEGRMTTKREE